MVAGSIRDTVFCWSVGRTGRDTERDGDPGESRHVPESSGEVGRQSGGRWWVRPVVATVALGVAFVAAVLLGGFRGGGLGSLGGFLTLGVAGLAATSEDDPVATLTEKVERARAGADVDIETDREDGLADLAAAVDGLVDDYRACDRERDLQERAVESAPVGVTIADVRVDDQPMIAVNEHFEEMTGYDESEAVGRNCRFLQGEDTDDEAVDELRRTIEAGGETTVELRNYRRDGTAFWNRVRLAPVETETGEVTHYVGFQEDVTDRVEREQRLEQHRAYNEDVLDAIDDVFYVFDDAGEIQRWNDSLNEVTGYTDAEIAKMHGTEFFPPDHHEQAIEAISTVFQTDEDRRVDAPVLTKDGEAIPYEFVATRVETPGGEEVLVGVGRDISVRKRREQEVRAAKERLQTYIETSPVAVVAVDTEGRVTLWNDAAKAVYGWSAEEMLGEPHTRLHPDVAEDDDLYERVSGGDSIQQVESKRVRKNGETIDVSLSATPVHDDDGDLSEVVAFVEDITERKERERELVARSAAMERSIDGIAILDETGRYVFVNQAHAEMYGYDDPERLVGETWELCYDQDERDRLADEALTALETEGNWRGEAVGERADGSTFPQEVSLTRLADGRIICVVRDVTERKEREQELERTKDMLQQAGRIAAVAGWEIDLTGDEPELNWTDELYRLYGVDPETEVDIDTAIEYYHPEDRSMLEQCVRAAIEQGESYDVEARLQPDGGPLRWVRAIGQPVFEDGEVVSVRGSIQDISRQKEHKLALESLHEATRGLLGVETNTGTAELVVDAAHEVLDVAGVAVYLLDDSTNHLDTAACSEGFERLCEAGPVGASSSESLLWNTYVTGTPTVFDDTQTVANSRVFGPDASGGLLIPIGDHGVFVVATRDRAVDRRTRQLAETLVATTEAAFDRLLGRARVDAQKAELQQKADRLSRQIQVTDLLRRIDQSLIQAESRAEVEAAVCDRLVESDDVTFAWLGVLDASGQHVDPSAWAGDGTDYLDAVALSLDGQRCEPAAATAATQTPTVVSNVVDDLKREEWRKTALSEGFQSVVSVPLVFEEHFYGVLTVYADDPDAFGDLEREVFAELGETVAHSVNAVETQRALHSDQRVELALGFDAGDDVLGRLATATDCRVELAGLAAQTETETTLFVTATGVPADRVAAALEDLVSVSEYRLIRDATADEDDALFEVTVSGDTLAARFVRHGAGPRSVVATPEGIDAAVDVPTATDVRALVEMLAETHPSVDLVSRRSVDRGDESGTTLASSLFESLTDRQLEVLRTAYFAGFFEWPRASTGEDVAEMLDVSQPTVNRHLRLGQQRLLEQLFEERSVEVAVEAD